MKNSIGIGVIGCGGMGRNLLARVLRQDPRLKVASLYDPDPRSIAAAHQEFGPELPVDADCHAMLARPDVDWVMIASWNCFHKEQTLAAFQAGKHVFCQNPLAISLDAGLVSASTCFAIDEALDSGRVVDVAPYWRQAGLL